MSRQQILSKYCVRCGRTTPSPYTVQIVNRYLADRLLRLPVVDLGCGNGRNANWLRDQGCRVRAFDMCPGVNAEPIMLGRDDIPVDDGKARLILLSYILMFLDDEERRQVMLEVDRIAAPDCLIIIELYAARDSHAPTKEAIDKLAMDCTHWFEDRGWKGLRASKGKRTLCRSEYRAPQRSTGSPKSPANRRTR